MTLRPKDVHIGDRDVLCGRNLVLMSAQAIFGRKALQTA
jgi:hypothetical protein